MLEIQKRSPLVMLFGPPASGKTLTLIRLTRWLWARDYYVEPIRTFRPPQDKLYSRYCSLFSDLVNNPSKIHVTTPVLVNVTRYGRSICQILDTDGNWCINHFTTQPPYYDDFEQILNTPNKKIWIIFLEPDWRDSYDRRRYLVKTSEIRSRSIGQNKYILLYNKIDCYNGQGTYCIEGAMKEATCQYPDLLQLFANHSIMTKIFKPLNCPFIPFTSGYFNEVEDKGQFSRIIYQESNDKYPMHLWDSIMHQINR